MRQRLVRILIVLSGLLALGLAGLFVFRPSAVMRMMPAPRFEEVVLSGRGASGAVIDCGGGWFNDGKVTEIIIRSEKTARGWERPAGITIRDCRIRGSIRIMGMGRNGEGREVQRSSVRAGHTQRAQEAAPARILISGVEIEAHHRIPLYLAPGVTGVVFEKSKLTGWSCSVGIYLDAESAQNVIRDNTFALWAAREVIAVDGSAANRIERNCFERIPRGGIYLYRNCGEGGTVRHQTPHANVIQGNHFASRSLGFWCHGIWLGSRNGRRGYCHLDDGYPFGSSLDNRDFADGNTVVGNVFSPPTARAIRDEGRDNRVE
ncbi:MAG: right-handed parallel beta-helix repeat-containing protein [Verrucomicrobiae bacterium]|nr:right-handed parallel beta-helix repeat-containing protein [Verrucomicrobiae bacterium]